MFYGANLALSEYYFSVNGQLLARLLTAVCVGVPYLWWIHMIVTRDY